MLSWEWTVLLLIPQLSLSCFQNKRVSFASCLLHHKAQSLAMLCHIDINLELAFMTLKQCLKFHPCFGVASSLGRLFKIGNFELSKSLMLFLMLCSLLDIICEIDQCSSPWKENNGVIRLTMYYSCFYFAEVSLPKNLSKSLRLYIWFELYICYLIPAQLVG